MSSSSDCNAFYHHAPEPHGFKGIFTDVKTWLNKVVMLSLTMW